ncbi:MAG: tRNA (guanosine(37)-N1)-methyltransferase TrmD [Bacteroidia bacterium]|nr:tRNA (guanosine(37)-N1)-methyltransferase TrmD [Bacteroidia bacterium]MDW8302426.1 tRNA (guanosine(37)-N1)-methyltransferase TrmD [Bacteroidia bacterium]
MRVDIISAVPDLLYSPLKHSILKRAQEKGLLEVHIHNLRDYATNKHKQIDDTVYGGGAGMVLMIEPIDNCISTLTQQRKYDEIIYLCPDGELFTQKIANQMSMLNNLILLCGHYKGVDERVREHLITREISIGDFVLSGGELPALVVVDAIARLIPGVLSDETSALTDSFQDDLIAPPVYTRPANYKGWKVPEILLSGNFAKIEEWRYEQSIIRTQKKRPYLMLKK